MKKLLFIAFPLILFSCGQQSNNPMTEEQKGRIIEEIKPLITQLWESNEQLNFEKFLEHYWNSKDFMFIGNGQIYGYNEIAGLEEVWKLWEYQKYNISNEKFEVLNQDAVLYTMQGNCSVKHKTGEIYKTDYYALSVLLRKVDGVWKIVFGHTSFPPLNMTSQENMKEQK